jgi:Xaa-Pro aminopeptidase
MTSPTLPFERRRHRYMDAIGAGSAAIFPAAPESVRSNDVEYRYRQSNDIYYLTGFREPGAVCLLLPGHPKDEFVLFVRPRDPERETWTGRRAGVEGAMAQYGASVAYPIDEIDQTIPAYLAECERVYYSFGRDEAFNQRVMGWMRGAQQARPRTGAGPTAILDAREALHEMRLHKEPEEIECLRQAIAITADAHVSAMRSARAGMREYEVEALVEYTFRRGGGAGPAYPSIVAAGSNATILHYTTNDCVMGAGDLLLLDAGAEFDGYCADVTRTFPIGPRFEARQRALYEIVLDAQLAAIDMIRPGVKFDEVHQRAVEVLCQGLLELKLLSGELAEIREKELYKPFYMHRTSHWLGLDVHDVGAYKKGADSRVLEPGMVLTVEPGIYVGDMVDDVAADWRGLGVRIEDDVLVTTDGHEVLSAAVPKAVDVLESLREDVERGSA